jgi:hypothetical protein
MGFQLHYLFIDEFGERSKTGVAKGVGKLGKYVDELVQLAWRMPFVQFVIVIFVELIPDGQLAFTGEGVDEISVAIEFSGPGIVDAVKVFES